MSYFEMRDPSGVWGSRLPDRTDYDDPTWRPDLRQEQTPWGHAWTDGSGEPREARLTVRVYVSAVSAAVCDRECRRVLALLRSGTAFRDRARSDRYLITQGLIDAPKNQEFRGRTTRLLTLTLALRDPFWHASDTDSSQDLYP